MIAGVACCVAMSMPQVHIVAYCADLGYGPAVGAQMLSIMLASGIVSRLASGWIADHIGGLRTLLLGSVLQGVALLLYIPFDGVTSLFVVSALFGCSRAGSCRATRSSCVSTSRRIKPAPGLGLCDGHSVWYGARRLDVGRGVRPYRLVSRRLYQRFALEPAQCLDRDLAAAARCAFCSCVSTQTPYFVPYTGCLTRDERASLVGCQIGAQTLSSATKRQKPE